MANTMRKRFKKGRDDHLITIYNIVKGEVTTYTATYQDLVFEGDTGLSVDEKGVREILASMLGGNKEPPESVRRLILPIMSYIELMTNMGVKYASASAGLRFSETGLLGARVYIEFTEEGEDVRNYVGWVALLKASFRGYDGYLKDSYHEVKKRLPLGDRVDVELLRSELESLVRIAYNAHRTRPRK